MAQSVQGAQPVVGSRQEEGTTAKRIDRSLADRLISWTGAVLAVALLALGGAAIYGGAFAIDNVRDRLEPQNITFPPAEAMSPEEEAAIGHYAGAKVDTGEEAEAFSRYIGGHLAEVNEGMTYSETSSQARAVDPEENPELAAELSGKADTLFKGETLRAILLNAYGWWTVGKITLYAGFVAVGLGLLLALFVGLGFRHARKAV